MKQPTHPDRLAEDPTLSPGNSALQPQIGLNSSEESHGDPAAIQAAERLLDGKPRPENPRMSQAQAPYVSHGLETGLMLYFRDSGDRRAFELLYRLSASGLVTWITTRVTRMGGRVSPEEVLQDAFVNIYRYSQSFRGVGPAGFRRWARTIAANAMNRSCRRRAIVFAEWTDGLFEVEGSECDPSIAAQDRELAQRLQSAYALVLQWVPVALDQLSARDRYVLTAIHVHGARYREVEMELGLRAGALKMIVHRARTRFQQALLAIGRRS